MEAFQVGENRDHDTGGALGSPGQDEQDDDELTNSTLFELTHLKEYTARKVEADDIRTILTMLKDEDYSQFHFEDPVLLYEKCCYSIAIFDIVESDRLVAAAFFDDTPINPDLMKLVKKWRSNSDVKSLAPINTLYLRCYVCNAEISDDVCLTEIISHTFSSSIHIEYIIVELPNLNYTGPYLFSPLVKEIEIPTGHHEKRKIALYKKDLLLPHLLVREGREHDLDDLMSLLPVDTRHLEEHFGKATLSDVIAMAERSSQSMVAEWKTEACGIISVSADLDYALLNGFYHLEPFHGLFKPHKNDQIIVEDDQKKSILEDINLDSLFMTAEQSFLIRQSQKGHVLITREEKARPPYDVELYKEFSLQDGGLSDDDSSALDRLLDDKPPKPHQFTAKVSEDIIMYGLRKRVPVHEPEEVAQVAPTEKRGSRRAYRRSTFNLESEWHEEDEEDDEELGEEEVGDEYGLEQGDEENTIEIIDGDDLAVNSEAGVMRRTIGSMGEEEDGENEEMVTLHMDNEEEDEEDEEGDVEEGYTRKMSRKMSRKISIAKPKRVSVMPEVANAPERAIEPTAPHDEEEDAVEEAESLATSTTVTRTSTTMDTSTVAHVSAARTSIQDPSGLTIASATDGDESDVTVVADKLQDVDNDSPLDSPEGETEDEHDSSTTEQQSLMPPPEDGEISKSENPDETPRNRFLEQSIALLQQMSPEVRRRFSEDTLYVGRRAPPRTYDQKVELFRKVADVYNMIQEEGLTLEQAREMITPADMDSLEEAEMLASGSLLKYITGVYPDESKFPFERRIVATPPQQRASMFHGIPNALAVKLFNMNKRHMLRHMDMFREIFKPFPNREYLVVTAPIGGSSREPAWLQNFVRVMPRVECSYPRDLFVLHKVVITAKLRVRKAKERDIGVVRDFLSSLLEKDKIFGDFTASFEKKRKDHGKSVFSLLRDPPKMTSYIAEVKNYEGTPIVALLILSDEFQVLKYAVNYDLEKHTYVTAHDFATDHAYVHHFIVNPLFQRHCKLIMKEVMRLAEKACLFHKIYPPGSQSDEIKYQSILNNMEDWIPLMPRKRIHYNHLGLTQAYDDERQPPEYVQDTSYPYALIHTGKKFVLEPKISLTKRIVFVGASTTTISCLEKLLSSTYRSFKYLTIIDPFGLPGNLPYNPTRNEFFGVRNGGVKMSYESDSEWVQRAGIHLWVQVVVGRVTSIVREGKYVVVDNEHIVSYDKLVLATGLQFQRLDCPEPEIDDPNFTTFKKNTATHKLQEHKRLKFVRDSPKPKNVFMINTEVEAQIALDFIDKYRPFMKNKKTIVFGGGLQTFCCIKALLSAGIPPAQIVLVGTPEKYIEWEKESGYILSSKVKLAVREELNVLGVTIIENYEFSHWETCPLSGLVKRAHFKSLAELEAHISFSTFALFCYRYRRVDDGIVSALSEAYLLYQNGIIIDASFRTNDHNIYAAGPAATYHKILLADHQNHIFYQSEDIGAKLAEILIESSGSDGGGHGKLDDFNVTKFKKPFIRAAILVGGWHYMYLRSPGNKATCSDGSAVCEEPCECTTEVVTGSVNAVEDPERKFFKLRLDDKQIIVSFECLSKSPMSFSNMAALYGQHESLLNNMMERLETGETTCLYKHFEQSWFSIFCIDEWSNFVDELKTLYREHNISGDVKLTDFIRDFISNLDNPDALQMDPNIIRSVWRSSKLKETVEEKLINFLKFHSLSLPMYATHNYVEDLLEERSNSTLYHPNTKSHMIQD